MTEPTGHHVLRGLGAMLPACVLLAGVGACVYAVTLLEMPVVSFVRGVQPADSTAV